MAEQQLCEHFPDMPPRRRCGLCEIRDLNDEVQRLQRALAFWLPRVAAKDSEANTRCGDDAFLLGGYEGPSEPCAEELGWIEFKP